jgi:hypothetical protein
LRKEKKDVGRHLPAQHPNIFSLSAADGELRHALISSMRYETLRDLSVHKIGFGTWRIGGEGSPDPSQDARSLAAADSVLTADELAQFV